MNSASRPAATGPAPHERVERGEQLVLHERVRSGQLVQERRLPAVRVPDESNLRNVAPLPQLAALGALVGRSAQPLLDRVDPLVDLVAVDLELRLARPARPNPGAGVSQGLSPSAQSRQLVAKLSQFHLKLRLLRRRPLREDVEDELRPVDDLAAERLFEVSRLAGAQVVVEDDHVGAHFVREGAHFLGLALADERRAVGAEAVLDHRRQRGDAGRVGERLELSQQVLVVPLEIDAHEDGLLRAVDASTCSEIVLDERTPVALTLLFVQRSPPGTAAFRPACRSRARSDRARTVYSCRARPARQAPTLRRPECRAPRPRRRASCRHR